MKYWAIYKLGVRQGLAYRFHLWAGILECSVKILALVLLWWAMFSRTDAQEMYGYSFGDLILYSVIARLVLTVSQPTISKVLPEDIKNGTLSRFLIKPVHYFKLRFAEFLGLQTVSFLFIYIVGTLLTVWAALSGLMETSLLRILFFGLTLVNSVLLLFLIYSVIGILLLCVSRLWKMGVRKYVSAGD